MERTLKLRTAIAKTHLTGESERGIHTTPTASESQVFQGTSSSQLSYERRWFCALSLHSHQNGASNLRVVAIFISPQFLELQPYWHIHAYEHIYGKSVLAGLQSSESSCITGVCIIFVYYKCCCMSTIGIPPFSSLSKRVQHKIVSRANVFSLYSGFPFPSNTIHFLLKLDIRNLPLLLRRDIKRIQYNRDISIMNPPHNLPSVLNGPLTTQEDGMYSLDITIPNSTCAINPLNHNQYFDERIR